MRPLVSRRLLAMAAVVGIAVVLAAAPAGAQEKSFTFPEVRIDATVLPDGSMDLVEHRTFLFTGGEFSVGTFGVDWPHDLVERFAVQQGGAPLTTRDVSEGRFFQAEWDFPTFETGRQTFDITYRVRCAVRVYTDRAHLYWQFVGTSDAGTDHVLVTVHLPGAATGPAARPAHDCPPPPPEPPPSVPSRPLERSEVLAKAFGPANGTFDIPDPQTVTFDVRDVPADGFVEGSILMPPAAVPLAFQQDHPIGGDELGKEPIPGGSPSWFADRNHRYLLALLLLAALPVLWIVIVIASRLRDRVGVPDDVTQPPEPLDPVDLAVLWGASRGQTFSTTAYATELLHLARIGLINMQPVGTVSNPSDFEVKQVGEPQSDVDREFLEFLFGTRSEPAAPDRPDVPGSPVATVATDRRISLNSLRRRGSNSRLKQWSNDLTARTKSRLGRLPKGQKRLGRRLIVWTALLGSVVGIALSVSAGDVAGLPQAFIWEAIIVGAVTVALVPPKLDPEFRARMAPWWGFRNYLREFSSLPEAPALAVIIWEQYLEYATALGVAKEVAKQVGSLVPVEQVPSPWPGAPSGLSAVGWIVAFHQLSAVPPSHAVTTSGSSSSGIGSFSSFGGSFSGGGGFGGGGTHVGAR
ncbi:MAG: DUF2207 family protein [Actinomycetota bacterium]